MLTLSLNNYWAHFLNWNQTFFRVTFYQLFKIAFASLSVLFYYFDLEEMLKKLCIKWELGKKKPEPQMGFEPTTLRI